MFSASLGALDRLMVPRAVSAATCGAVTASGASSGSVAPRIEEDRPIEAATRDDTTDAPVDEEEEGAGDAERVATPTQKVAVAAKPKLHPAGLLTSLSEHGLAVHPESDTQSVLAPEEVDRVPMLQRGVTLAFLQQMIKELTSLGRGDIDCGQWLNGTHTTSSATDWKECVASRFLFDSLFGSFPHSIGLLYPPALVDHGIECVN